MDGVWRPHVVVAALIERDGRFLMVEEETAEGIRLNQPAGHLEPGESLLEAVQREVLEETARQFTARTLVAIYRLPASGQRPDFIRFTFSGEVGEPDPRRTLDHGILRADWFDPHLLRGHPDRHRSELVMRSIDDYLRGRRFDLAILQDCGA